MTGIIKEKKRKERKERKYSSDNERKKRYEEEHGREKSKLRKEITRGSM